MDGRLVEGRFRLLESHAMGGMASIWRATDEDTGEVVAVKRLHPHLVADPAARQRLVREAAALAAIHHPNVVGIRDVVDGDEPALVMDLVEGRSVAEMAAEGHRFTRSEALAIAAGIADGLAVVHERGIIHRDVKPANILVGQDGVARLSDFGIAIAPDDDTALTAEDGVIGTLRYLAPERLAGEPATTETDVWGVGAVLYELLTSRPAFPSSTPAERVELASRPVERPAGLAAATWGVIATCLASDPGDRYPDGAGLAAALHALPGVPAPAAEAPDTSAATEVIALSASAAPGSHSVGVPGASSAGRRPPRLLLPPERARTAWVGGILAVLAIAIIAAAGASNDRADGALSSTTGAPRPTTSIGTPAATLSEAPPDAGANATKPGKGKGNEQGKGKGRGN